MHIHVHFYEQPVQPLAYFFSPTFAKAKFGKKLYLFKQVHS